MKIRIAMKHPDCKKKHFFNAINGSAIRLTDFLKREVVRCHQVWKEMQTMKLKNRVIGFGSNGQIVTHGCRGISTQSVVKNGIPNSAISKRTSHRIIESICNGQNVLGNNDIRQKKVLFPCCSVEMKQRIQRTTNSLPLN